jgi:hypothetical protein
VLRRALRELLGFAPAIVLYLSLAFWPERYSDEDIGWLVGVQFFLFELPAAFLAIVIGGALARGTHPPPRPPRWGEPAPPPRPLSPCERDAAVLLAGIAFVLGLPWVIYSVFDSPMRGLGVASAFLPRMLDAWRFRSQPASARALMHGGYLSFAFCAVVIGVPLLLSAGGPVSVGAVSGAHTGGLFIAAYYATLALGTAWLYRRAGA